MAKAVKKKRTRRLKKSIRRTLGALFMISALIVAAIPTENLQASGIMPLADPGGTSISAEVFGTNSVPKVDANATIYTCPSPYDSSVLFRFAYVSTAGSMDSSSRYAVILGYEQVGNLTSGVLQIPETLEAYRKYSMAESTGGNVAVDISDHFLYYKVREPAVNANGQPIMDPQLDSTGKPMYNTDGTPIYVQRMVDRYKPCYDYDKANWKDATAFYSFNGTGFPGVSDNNASDFTEVKPENRISAALVAFIGSQYLKEENGIYKIAGEVTSAKEGIFANETNFTSLVLPDSIRGVGQYAFAYCGFATVTFGNGLHGLGNHAFEGCRMTEVKFDLSCSVQVVGDHCFAGCTGLTSIRLPGNVNALGDSAFEGCTALKTVDMIYPDYVNNKGEHVNMTGVLREMGKSVFKDCQALDHIEFPVTYTGDVLISEFQNCYSLQYIRSGYGDEVQTNTTSGSMSFNLVDDGGYYTIKDFVAAGPKDENTGASIFYLWGPKGGSLHQTATREQIAYKFYDSDFKMYVYEKVVQETEGTITYWVNEENQLVKCEMSSDNITNITLPESIGPKNISGIDAKPFHDKCFLETVTIPASVKTISADAFKGCHHLTNVIFTDATALTSIGTGAFSTQVVTNHMNGCRQDQTEECELYFTGTISSGGKTTVPFEYAMDPSQYINTGTQYRTYITYYSGWPTNLAVRYNDVLGLNELVDYPTFQDLQDGKYKMWDSATKTGYAYMTPDYVSAAQNAVASYPGGSDYEKTIWGAALNVDLPVGIESIATVDRSGNLVVNPDEYGTVSSGDADNGLMSLFSYKEDPDRAKAEVAKNITNKTLTTHSIENFKDGAFEECDTFSTVNLEGNVKSIGNYAFDGCDNLTSVSISESVSSLGLRPFTNCSKLTDVNFNGSEKFECIDSIIYELGADGNKEKLVEYLTARNYNAMDDPSVLAGLKAIYPEAFMSTGVKVVDLSGSSLEMIPRNAFANTMSLYSVTLPNTCKGIESGAFSDSTLEKIRIPRSVGAIAVDAFDDTDGDGYTNKSQLWFECAEDSNAWTWAEVNGINPRPITEPEYWKVTFFNWNGDILGVQEKVEDGTAATPPEVPEREGYIFTGWMPAIDCITDNTTTTAQFEPVDPDTLVNHVIFMDDDYTTVFKTVTVPKGGSVAASDYPPSPSRAGYVFEGWKPLPNNVTEDNFKVYAYYTQVNAGQCVVYFHDDDGTELFHSIVNYGENAMLPQNPVKEGYTFQKWVPEPVNITADTHVYAYYTPNNGTQPGDGPGTGNQPGDGSGTPGNNGGNGTQSGNGSGDNTNTSKFYTLTVQNGSGSGSYVAGSQPIIICNDPTATQEFSHWTISPEDTKIASKVLTATVITMPEGDVTVTAHYRARTGSSNGSGSSSSTNSTRPNNTHGVVGGTTVVIDKNGLSNTGVVSATVNGSSDNFVVKITESTDATEAIIRALMAEYGSLDNIKYFPMDISLYDSTGTYKITDTTGLSVDITLPLPDSLITYAGNNKVAGVVNDRLDKLSPKFTTISGVPCVTFRAEHFSPYVIYVDIANLSAGESSDYTPKTGDGIHPKWFLSIGLACLSFVMFMQKDRRKPKRVKVRAK